MSVHFCITPMRETYRAPDGERWCFMCRDRRRFFYVVSDVIEQPTYYEPTRSIQCEGGHSDGDLFPGGYREWD